MGVILYIKNHHTGANQHPEKYLKGAIQPFKKYPTGANYQI